MNFENNSSKQVKVFCRIRPCVGAENECLTIIDDHSLYIQSAQSGTKARHNFSKIYGPNESQQSLFTSSVLPFVEKVLNGENALFFTYGVTGGGKTYTMEGDLMNPGVIPRSLDVIFNSISTFSTPKYVVKPNGQNGFNLQSEAEAIMDRQRLDYMAKPKTPSRHDAINSNFANRFVEPSVFPLSRKALYTVFISFIELYNNNIYDLLDTRSSTGSLPRALNIHEDIQRNTYVQGVTEIEAKTANEALTIFYQGKKRRRVGSTTLNNESSRSHAVFSIRLVKTGYDSNYDEVVQDTNLITSSQLCLVDLAGSERTNRSGTTGSRLKEASTINNSLMNLRICIEILRSNQSPVETNSNGLGVYQPTGRLVPYRDTKLTRLFKNFFEGNGQIVILICVHSTMEEYTETVQVLQFAEQSQQISTGVPSTPRAPPASGKPMSSSWVSSPALDVCNEELIAAIAQTATTDTSLLDCVSKIISVGNQLDPFDNNNKSNQDERLIKCRNLCCPDADDPDHDLTSDGSNAIERNSSRNRRRSSRQATARHSAHNCAFLLTMRNRAEVREHMRGLLQRLNDELQTSVSDVYRMAEKRNSNINLCNTLETMKVERLQMESKLRYLENEVSRQKTLVRHERNERMRETDGARTQMRKLQSQKNVVGRTTPSTANGEQVKRSTRSRQPQDEGSEHSNEEGNVATLSRQWESRCASKLTSRPPWGSRNVPSTTPITRWRLRNQPAVASPTAAETMNRPAPMNPRHRRSKSTGDGIGSKDTSVWLEHKENFAAPLGTIFTPSIAKIRKSASTFDIEDTLKATNYVLHHQTADQKGNVQTQLFKGAIIPTAGGGSAVIFNDVEELNQRSPLSTTLGRHSQSHLKNLRSSSGTMDDEDVIQRPSCQKRRHSNRRRSLRSLDSQASAASSLNAIGVGECCGGSDEEMRSQASSYHHVSPPCMEIDMSRYLGISSGGGITMAARKY